MWFEYPRHFTGLDFNAGKFYNIFIFSSLSNCLLYIYIYIYDVDVVASFRHGSGVACGWSHAQFSFSHWQFPKTICRFSLPEMTPFGFGWYVRNLLEPIELED
jgi:hypothetical protein